MQYSERLRNYELEKALFVKTILSQHKLSMRISSACFLLSGVFDMSSDFVGSQGIFKSGYGFSPKEVMKNTSGAINRV